MIYFVSTLCFLLFCTVIALALALRQARKDFERVSEEICELYQDEREEELKAFMLAKMQSIATEQALRFVNLHQDNYHSTGEELL